MPSKFSASNAERLMSCHASANLPAAIPNWVDPEPVIGGMADQGTSMHMIFEAMWALPPSERTMALTIMHYVDDLMRTRRFKKLIEHTFNATWLTGAPETTPDLVLYTNDEIHVIDTKWGKIRVEVVDNKQLLYYDVCVLGLAPKAKVVTNHILQPRADNMSSAVVTKQEVLDFRQSTIVHDRAIQAGDLTFGPSDHGCMFCPANPHGRGGKGRPLCPVMLDMLYPNRIDEDAILNL